MYALQGERLQLTDFFTITGGFMLLDKSIRRERVRVA